MFLRFILALVTVWNLSGQAFAEDGSNGLFSLFASKPYFVGSHAAPHLPENVNQDHLADITGSVNYVPNFAGEFVVRVWQCGPECWSGALVNARTGDVWAIPRIYEDQDVPALTPFTYKIDSRLLLVRGCLEPGGKGREMMYVIGRNGLKPVDDTEIARRLKTADHSTE